MDEKTQVVVTDVSMPFASMVVFMIKWAFASIPAMIILGFCWWLFATMVYELTRI